MALVDVSVADAMTNVSDLHQFRVRTPSFLITADYPAQMSGLQQQLLLVDQLRREAAIKRINVGQAVEDLKKYVSQNEQEDYLLMGFSSQKSNPFREKSSCNLL